MVSSLMIAKTISPHTLTDAYTKQRKHRMNPFINHHHLLPAAISQTKVVTVSARIQIDRRSHFEQSLRRQLAAEARELELAVSCPVECVREVRNCAEFDRVLNEAEVSNKLVIVDFYSNSCGACKYLFPEIMKLCKQGCGEQCDINNHIGVIFLKHNVRDEYDDLTDLARLYHVRTVPMFKFFKNGSPFWQTLTRNREHLKQALCDVLQNCSED